MLMLKSKFAKFVMGLMVVSVMSLGAVSTVNATEIQPNLDNQAAQEEIQKESFTNYHASAQFTYNDEGDKILTVTPKSEFRSHHDAVKTQVIDEETPVVVDEETPVVDEETPVVVDEETPVVDEETPVVVDEEAPIVDDEGTPIVDDETPLNDEVAPVEITKLSVYDQLVKTYEKLLNLYETLLNNFALGTAVVEEETPVVVDETTPDAIETPVLAD